MDGITAREKERKKEVWREQSFVDGATRLPKSEIGNLKLPHAFI
jgi:hypothetical protein